MARGQYRGAFVVEAASGPRFELALERFLGGRSFEIGEVSFAMASDGTILVAIGTSWSLSNVTVATATADFEVAQSAFRELVVASRSFADAVRGHAVRFELVHDDGMGSVLLCTLEDGAMLWAPRMPAPIAPAPRDPKPAVPAEVQAPTIRWLNEMDDGLAALARTARGFDPPIGPALAQAVWDVVDRIAHFRLALIGAVELTDLLPSDAKPLGIVNRSIAEVIQHDIGRVATLPAEVTNAAHSHLLEESVRRAFLRQVGEVASIAFVSLARSLWEEHPDLAPPGWVENA